MAKLMICALCGCMCEKRGGKQKFCEHCREEGNKRLNRERDILGRPAATKIGEMLTCDQCGVEVVRKQARQRMCSDCLGPYWATVRAARCAERLAKRGIVVGSVFTCTACGLDSIRKSAHHKFCEICAENSKIVSTLASKDRNREAANDNAKRWRSSPRGKEWQREYRNKPENKVHNNMSRAIRSSITGKGGRSWETLLGYTTEELIKHLERQFLPGMTWENYGEWHIDHRRPRASFSFTSADDKEFMECWSISNLQPLWELENKRKSDKNVYLL
ncbi:hypothetical protein EHH54_31780 [Rhizobium leguminosarum]|uniref:hypothetical protein n=1 Tax=Rhizobium leguminosarum TaxID=384 RepID=UPI000FEC7727|nr:hypothetical protein [Rhizobium leguminosarum]RWX28957.1 hypothetical protein EHH54_31780 [Rhizobium leguminosarum]